MVSTEDSDGCARRTGQRGMSEQGVRSEQILKKRWKLRELPSSHPPSGKANTGCKKLERKTPDRQVGVEKRGKKRGILFQNQSNFFKNHTGEIGSQIHQFT